MHPDPKALTVHPDQLAAMQVHLVTLVPMADLVLVAQQQELHMLPALLLALVM